MVKYREKDIFLSLTQVVTGIVVTENKLMITKEILGCSILICGKS